MQRAWNAKQDTATKQMAACAYAAVVLGVQLQRTVCDILAEICSIAVCRVAALRAASLSWSWTIGRVLLVEPGLVAWLITRYANSHISGHCTAEQQNKPTHSKAWLIT